MDVFRTTRWLLAVEIADGQHGRITAEQLRAVGIGRSGIEKALRSGRLHRVFQGVYALGHRAPSAMADRMAAALRCGPHAAVSHRPAAVTHGIRLGDPWPIDVTSPTGRGRGVRGIRAHRSPLPAADLEDIEGVPVTTVARTIADLAHEVSERDLRQMIREAQFLGTFDLTATIRANARRPSHSLSAILDDLVPTESPLEDLFRERILKRFRLPEPDYQVRLSGARTDFRWARARLTVEVDGAHHANPLTRQADMVRDNALQLGGELVLRYSQPDITRHARRTAGQIARGLRERGGYSIQWM